VEHLCNVAAYDGQTLGSERQDIKRWGHGGEGVISKNDEIRLNFTGGLELQDDNDSIVNPRYQDRILAR
jgi:hypothetical protein